MDTVTITITPTTMTPPNYKNLIIIGVVGLGAVLIGIAATSSKK